jgi:hypothetical protein
MVAILLKTSGRELARVPIAEPVPATVEHCGQTFARSHRTASGWAYEVVRPRRRARPSVPRAPLWVRRSGGGDAA